jgi:hypothetical protein
VLAVDKHQVRVGRPELQPAAVQRRPANRVERGSAAADGSLLNLCDRQFAKNCDRLANAHFAMTDHPRAGSSVMRSFFWAFDNSDLSYNRNVIDRSPGTPP